MKSILSFTLFFLGSLLVSSQDIHIPVDTTVITNHTSTIKGQKISYTATTGTQPVWDKDGKAIATLYYTYYKRTSKNIIDNI